MQLMKNTLQAYFLQIIRQSRALSANVRRASRIKHILEASWEYNISLLHLFSQSSSAWIYSPIRTEQHYTGYLIFIDI